MSAPAKAGLIILLIVAVAGAGYLGARTAAAQRAAVAAVQLTPQSPVPNPGPSTARPGRQTPAWPQRPGAPGFNRPDMPGFGGRFGYGGRGSMMPGFRGQGSRGFRGPDNRGGRGGWAPGFQPGPRGFNNGRRGAAPAAIPGGWFSQYRSQFNSAAADALGVTIEEYDKAIAEGQTPWQIAQGKGISAADFQAKMLDAMAVVVKQAVADGKLTQAQADALLARMKQGGARMWGPLRP